MLILVLALLACTGDSADTGDTAGTGGTIAGDSLCRVEQSTYDGGDTALLAELEALITPLSAWSVVHWSTSLHDGADSAISITLGEVGAPVLLSFIEVPHEDWGEYEGLATCPQDPQVALPFSASFDLGPGQAVGAVTARAVGTDSGTRAIQTDQTTALTLSTEWQALVDAQTADLDAWQGGPVEVVVQLASGGVAILGQSPTVTREWWLGGAE